MIQKHDNGFLAVGALTLLKATQEVSIPFTHENGLLKGEFSLNRADDNLGTKFPTFVVGKTIQVAIKVKLK